jgi:hypothetical protein
MNKKITLVITSLIMTAASAYSQIYTAKFARLRGTFEGYIPRIEGCYYGEINQGYANGRGVYYYKNGDFIYGNFRNGYVDGDAVLVSKENGYVAGCWIRGFFRKCETNYNGDDYLRNIICEVQGDMLRYGQEAFLDIDLTGGEGRGQDFRKNNRSVYESNQNTDPCGDLEQLPAYNEEADVPTYDPEGYKITEIDANTPMGKTMLGRIKR